jgi:voltage-gated potassium channel
MIYTAVGVLVMVYAASLAILDLERARPHSSINDFGDAVWWSTGAGRFVAVALMVGGVSLLGVVTATLASWIVQRVAEEDTAGAAATAAQIEELRDEIRKLTETVTRRAEHAYGEAVGQDRVSED